ncbi:MAG: argininosuccinate lyase [Candidatus Omnitrophica bacterium]|nr:argininosuccinate lyase [Candidatus Omnitrophota bacterium]
MGKKAGKLWGGRFSRPTSEAVERFTHSLAVDQRLAWHDLLGSIAHARMLGKARIIPSREARRIVAALQALLRDLGRGRLSLNPAAEDIHTALQLALEKRIGTSASYLHTGRSRNDQVVTSLRLFLKEKLQGLDQEIGRLQRGILVQAESAKELVMPGFTHLRHAQPLLVGHLLLSYVAMLQRDRQRLEGALHRLDELPLGSGALTGTGLPINRAAVARELGFSRLMENSVDAVTDRDFVVEILAASSILGAHCSRIAEDLILWSTREFGFLRFDERLLTGSSMMPQKQNPDFLELVRGGCARITGNLAAILTLLKGLPSGYQRDLQNDKELLFEGLDRIDGMLAVLIEGFGGIRWIRENLKRQTEDESLYATDLAELLVARGIPFAQAHRSVGQLFAHADRTGKSVGSLPLETVRRFSKAFGPELYALLDPAASVRRKRSAGGTNPLLVRQAIRRWKGIVRR